MQEYSFSPVVRHVQVGVAPELGIQVRPGNLRFGLNKAARIALGNPAHVKIGYDQEHHAVSIAATSPDDPGAYCVASYGQVCAHAFILGYGIPDQRNLPLESVDGALVARLRKW